ncbi:uncharacterized protein PV07_11600 [Cladophialophora immunda]|uniref:ChrR-like cupin domain-containing protein n=1 Tax=Cladophialophora immunda TaxID=569365 RepID=A0A0D2CIK3_9EURO|nr:uncharacterized protein PV07_11600 [Cladophialophora immunda]KIW23399.1 hypothetical protein PV07_11600 [Cladophialophora immunda]
MPLEQKEFSLPPPHPPPGTPVDPDAVRPWHSIGPGIWELLLNGSRDSEEKSVLQWYEPNAVSVTDGAITHPYVEEVCLLQGGLEDLTLRQAWSTGAYAYRYPGMEHGPYKASPTGCLMFVKLLSASRPVDLST